MSSESSVPGQMPRQGMSRGAKVVLIVVSVFVGLVIIVGVVLWLKCEDIQRAAVNSTVLRVRSLIDQAPAPGVDTVRINAMSDAFVEKNQTAEIDGQGYLELLQGLRSVMEDDQIDSTETEQFIQSMIDYFPELDETFPAAPKDESDSVIDSMEASEE